MSVPSTQKSPRNPWPIAIAGYFTVVIISITVFISWSVRQNEDLVRKDYYAEEIQFQQHLDQMNRTQALNQKPAIEFDPTRNVLTIFLPNAEASATGDIHFYRPSDATLDRNVKLSLKADGSQQIDGRQLREGLWKVRVTWTAHGQQYFCEKSIIVGDS
jgi:nitrogen fixation protein FixH